MSDETPKWIRDLEPKRESIVDKLFPLAGAVPERSEAARGEAVMEALRERIKASVPPKLANAIWLAAKQGSPSESPRLPDAVLVAAIKVWPEIVDEIEAALHPERSEAPE